MCPLTQRLISSRKIKLNSREIGKLTKREIFALLFTCYRIIVDHAIKKNNLVVLLKEAISNDISSYQIFVDLINRTVHEVLVAEEKPVIIAQL